MNIRLFPRYDPLGRLEDGARELGRRLRRGARLLAPAQSVVEPAEIEAPNQQVVDRFQMFARWGGVIAAFVGYHVLLGHIFGIRLLLSPGPGIPSVTSAAALCSLASGSALYLLQAPGKPVSGVRRRVAQACIGIVLVLAILGLGGGFGMELAPRPPMGVASSVAFLSLGVGLLLADLGRASSAIGVLALVPVGVSLQALVAYLYGAEPFEGQMSFYSAFATLLVSAGLLCAHGERGFMAKVASSSLGGVMARQLLPAALVVPILLGWLQQHGQRAGLYGSAPGLASLAVANVAVFVVVVWWGVNSLYRMDTKRRQAERELKDTAAKLRRSNADLEQFAYVTSHDLKEPLRAISGSVQVLQSRFGERLGVDAEESIRHTVDGANRMQTLIDDLLTYSRLTTRDTTLEPTDCEEVFGEALANLEVPLRESRAIVTHDPLPVVRGDRTQLIQVFQNLVGNALKYRSERTPKIHAGVEERGDEWLFTVRDNGIGIAPQYADRIFKIFQRLHTRKDYPGTGIGLAVCKTVVERHGGRIWVESEPEEGSTFSFTLPS